MNKKINYSLITSIILVLILMVSFGLYSNTVGDLKNTINHKNDVISAKDSDLSTMANELSTLNQNLLDAQTAANAAKQSPVEETKQSGYLLDGYSIGDSVNEKFSDRELSLFDGKIEYDNEDYNADEYLDMGGRFVYNEDDMGSDVYMAFSKEDIKYNFVFDDELNFSNDESLKFNFLGSKIEVIKWNGDSITIKTAGDKIVSEGETISVDNHTIFLDMVMDGSIWVTVDKESEKIKEGDCAEVGGIDICVSDVLYSSKETIKSKAVIAVANEVEEDIESGDQYKDSMWNWDIDYGTRTIGLVLAEKLEDLDEDFTPLSVGETICLPNDYVCAKFNGLSSEDMTDISLDYDESDDETTINGDFEYGTEDIDELIVNDSGMYYENEDNDMVSVNSVNVKNSDVNLTLSGRTIYVGDIQMPKRLKKVIVSGEDYKDEGMYRSVYGSIVDISNDLESHEDNELSISVPEEQLEVSFLMY